MNETIMMVAMPVTTSIPAMTPTTIQSLVPSGTCVSTFLGCRVHANAEGAITIEVWTFRLESFPGANV